MPIENSSLSNLSISNAGAGKPKTQSVESPLNTPIAAVGGTPFQSSKTAFNSPAAASQDLGADPDLVSFISPSGRIKSGDISATLDGSGILGIGARDLSERINTVFEYDSTVFDTEITGSGICSAYPVILGTVPITNLYSNDSLTNLGTLYQIQNDLKDSTIQIANSVVNQYYLSVGSVTSDGTPATPDLIAETRDRNLEQYNALVSSISKISGLRQQLLETTEINNPSDLWFLRTSIDSATSVAEASSVLGLSVEAASFFPLASTESGDFGNLKVNYVDDDVTKYNNSSKGAYEQFVERFIGKKISPSGTEYERNSQLKTTRQYQLLKAALFQKSQGIRLNDIEEYGYENPYDDLSATKIASLQEYTFDNIAMNSSLTFARASIQKISDLYAGYDLDPAPLGANEIREIAPGYGIAAEVGGDEYPDLAIKRETLTNSFVNQIATALASEIMEASGFSNLNNLPVSIRPGNDFSDVPFTTLRYTSLEQTTSDPIRYIQDSNGQILTLYDNSISSDISDDYSTLTDTLLYSQEDLVAFKESLIQIRSNLSSFSIENNADITNQCALTILKTFYSNFITLFTVMFLSPTTELSRTEAVRAAMLGLASKNDENALMLLSGILGRRGTFFVDTSGEYTFLTGAGSGVSTGDSSAKQIEKNQAKIDIDTGEGAGEGLRDEIFDASSTFGIFEKIVDALAGLYPSISTSEDLKRKIKISAFSMCLFFMRKMRLQIELYGDSEWLRGYVKYSKSSAAFLVESLIGAFENTQASDLSFDFYRGLFEEDPEQGDIEIGQDSFFKFTRGAVRFSIQASQDIKSLLAYQLTVIDSQVDAISQIESQIAVIANRFDGDSERASRLVGRYLTPESVVELLYRSSRYQTSIPGTEIRTIAARSKNYRAIVESVFKDRIPGGGDLHICIVGVPYGHIERLRLASRDRSQYFNVELFADSVSDDVFENRIDYSFKYRENSANNRPDAGGPFNSRISDLYDNFETNAMPSSPNDDSIGYLVPNEDFTGLKNKLRSDLTGNEVGIDFSVALIQAALQSYLEDVYGIYVRYALTKTPMSSTPYPEQATADLALASAGYDTSNSDRALEYARIRSTVMMHRDFITSLMLDDLESSPAFDKVMYILFRGNDLGNVVTEFYTRISA